MVAPVLREPAFVWSCVALAGGCLAAAVAVRARKFLRELSEQFIRLPPSGKAVLAATVVVATVFAQKPTNVSTNQHESTRAEVTMPAYPPAKQPEGAARRGALNTEETEGGRHGEGHEVLDRSDKIDRISEADASNPSNPMNPVKETPCLPSSNYSVFSVADTPPLSSNDVVRGYRLETVRTNEAISYTRPTNARLVGTWHLTDAYRGRARVLFPSTNLHESAPISIRDDSCQFVANSPRPFRFPLGGHVVTSLWAHTWGKVRPQLRNASNEIFVIGAPMFARHDQSFLWTAAKANGSALLTWENFFLGNPYERLSTNLHESTRISICENSCQFVDNPPVNAQLELFPNGDFIARSNSVERVYRRVNPDDWDDDGITNGADDAPLVPSDTPQFGPHQTLPEGANADAYCWVDLVVRQANAQVTFAGDGASNLADPAFIAEADATNHVTLLIGKTYRVTCPMPFEIAAKSSDDIEDSWEEDRQALWLHWPVAIARKPKPTAFNTEGFEERRHGEGMDGLDRIDKIDRISESDASNPSNPVNPVKKTPCLPPSNTSVLSAAGFSVFSDSNTSLSSFTLLSSFQTFSKPSRTFTMQVVPLGLGEVFTWTNVCCRVSGSDYSFSITCGDSCACGGCSATGYLEYEGYRLPAYGGSCGCSGSVDHPGDDQDPDKDPPLPGASATFSKRVVFFEDEYENAPGETVPWRSTETELDCWAYGGTRGGHVRIEIRGADGLVQYGGSPLPFECDLEPGEEVTFKNTYRAVRPSGGEDDIIVTATFTENETDWSQTTIDKATAIRLKFRVNVLAPENDCDYRHRYGVREKVECSSEPSEPKVTWVAKGNGFVRGGEFSCPLTAASDPLTARCNGVEYMPSMAVVEPTGVEARNVGAVVYKVPIGHAGGIGMEIPSYALPLDVSFSQIAIEEVPNDGGSAIGYFTHSDFRNWWHHDENTGAGNWLDVDVHNKIGIDYPRLESELYRMTDDGLFVDDPRYGWRYGELNWDNPFGWNEQGTAKGTPAHKRFAVDEKQKMVIFETGRTGVWKLRNVVTRDIDGTVYLNGVKVR